MNFLSKTEYENQINPFKSIDKLVDIGFPDIYFYKMAIYVAKSVQYLFPEEQKKIYFSAIETAEKYLRGEATDEECKKATDAAFDFLPGVNHAPSSVEDAIFDAISVIYFVTRSAYYAAAYTAVLTVVNALKIANANADKTDATCDMLIQLIPWNLVCSFQIAKCFGNEKNEQFIQEITKDENLINYATILLEDENLRNEFEFLIKDYVRNENFIKN